MKFLLMCCCEEKKLEALTAAERETLKEDISAYCDALHRSGHLIVGELLDSAQTAITLRVHNGRASVTDGPFAETKEQLGGVFLINARDLNEAIQVASRFPSVAYRTMGVRPVIESNRKQWSCPVA